MMYKDNWFTAARDPSPSLRRFVLNPRLVIIGSLMVMSGGYQISGQAQETAQQAPPQGVQENAPANDLQMLVPFSVDTPFQLNSIELLSLGDIAAGTSMSLDQFEPRTAMEAFTADRLDSEPVVPITIDTVRLLALENNLDLKTQFARPAIAEEILNEEEARFDSIFTASLNYFSRETALDPTLESPIFTSDGFEAALQLDLPLRSGGTATVAIPTTFTSPDIDGADDVQDSTMRFSISQPLLRNAGRRIAESPIEVARLQSVQEQARTKLSAIQTLSTAESAYWDFYAAAQSLDTRYEQYLRALELERKAIRLADARVISQIEVTRAKSGVARKLEGIIIAESQRRLTQRRLKVLMNDGDLPLGTPTNLAAASQPDPVFYPLDRDAVVSLAIENRLDLIDVQLQLSVEDLTFLFNENQQKPLFDLNADTSFGGRGDNFGNSFGSDFTSWQIGARFSVPIGNQAAESRTRRASIQRDVTRNNIRIQKQLIAQQVLDALDQLEQSWQRILAARQEVTLAGDTFAAEERQFLAGVRTSTDVLEAADFLAEAQLREIQALASYEKDKINAALATGTLLGKGQIRLDVRP